MDELRFIPCKLLSVIPSREVILRQTVNAPYKVEDFLIVSYLTVFGKDNSYRIYLSDIHESIFHYLRRTHKITTSHQFYVRIIEDAKFKQLELYVLKEKDLINLINFSSTT